MQSIIQILKVNEVRAIPTKTGTPFNVQDAECMLLKPDGTIDCVGVLALPREMMGDNAPALGVYTASFGLAAGYKDRKINAVLANLLPVPPKAVSTVRSPSAA